MLVSHVGQHQVSVQGSSFNVKAIDRPVYRREYSKVGDRPASRFGSKGAGDGQFTVPHSVTCNLRGEIFLS